MSPAPVEADVDSATYDMVAQCGAGGQPILQIEPSQYTYEVVVLFVGVMEV
jgi:hypothetical protein